jgi:CrcB protein
VRPSAKLIALAFAGGALGTLARYGVGLAANWVLAVVLVNLLGAAFLGMANGLGARPGNHFSTDGARAFWGVVFAGGFTTMSGLAGVFVALNLVGLTVLSAVFMVGQLVLGVLVYLAALKLATGKPAATNLGQAE